MTKITSLLVGFSFIFCACTTLPGITQMAGEGIGTYYLITIAEKHTICQAQIDSVITALSNTASIFNSNSLVSRINRNETDTLNPILKHLLKVSLQVSEETGGAFDFTVGALVNLWGFGKDPQSEVLPEDVERALQTVGYKKIRVEGNQIMKENPETQLNFNAIAKGYCVDLVAGFLTSKGVENFIVDIGGELCVRGKRTPHTKWRVGIQKPTENREGEIAAEEVMELQNIAVATSGNYRNYIEKDGKRLGHTINPHTGYPETNNLLSATVLASTCAFADAYATAFMVLGKEKTETFLSQHADIEAYLIDNIINH